jgi:hypothetical protein
MLMDHSLNGGQQRPSAIAVNRGTDRAYVCKEQAAGIHRILI